jgi:hypothetical protein
MPIKGCVFMEFEISIDEKVISAYEELSDAIVLYRKGILLKINI